MADSCFCDGCCVRASNRYSRSWALSGAVIEFLQGRSQCERFGAENCECQGQKRFTTMGLQLSL